MIVWRKTSIKNKKKDIKELEQEVTNLQLEIHELMEQEKDTLSMIVDQEYRLTLMEVMQ